MQSGRTETRVEGDRHLQNAALGARGCRTGGQGTLRKHDHASVSPPQQGESLQVLQALHHPNVVSCKEAFVSSGKLCILMDYCSEGKAFAVEHPTLLRLA